MTTQPDHPGTAGRNRTLGVVLLMFALALTAMVTPLALQIRKAQAANRLLEMVDALADQVPPDHAADEWGVAVYWTHNLHHESVPQVYASRDDIVRLHEELSLRCDSGADNGDD